MHTRASTSSFEKLVENKAKLSYSQLVGPAIGILSSVLVYIY